MTDKKTGNRWRKLAVELVGLLLIVTAVSMFLVKDMLAVDEQVPELYLPDLATVSNQGEAHFSSVQFKQSDKTLIYFFAPWCSICSISMPGLSLLPDSENQIIVVALDWQSVGEVQQFIDKVGYKGTVLLGNDQIKSAYKIDAYPSYYVVDDKGSVVHRDRGFSTPPGVWLRLN